MVSLFSPWSKSSPLMRENELPDGGRGESDCAGQKGTLTWEGALASL